MHQEGTVGPVVSLPKMQEINLIVRKISDKFTMGGILQHEGLIRLERIKIIKDEKDHEKQKTKELLQVGGNEIFMWMLGCKQSQKEDMKQSLW